MTIVTRTGKGSALTVAELDNNFSELDTRTALAWQNLAGEISTAGIASAPDLSLYKGLIYVMSFSATVSQEFTVVFHIPKNFVEGSDIYPHIHVTPGTVSTGNVDWHFEYTWANDYDGEDILLGPPASDQKYGTPADVFTMQTVAATHIDANTIVEFGPINIPAIKGDAVVIAKIVREPLDVLDTYPDAIYVTNCDMYVQVQKFGGLDR